MPDPTPAPAPAPTYTPEHRRRLESLADPGSCARLGPESREAITAVLAEVERLQVRLQAECAAWASRNAESKAEVNRLRDRIAAMEAPDPVACAKLLGIDPARRDITIEHWAVPSMARSFAEFLGDAPNYRSIAIEVTHREPGDSSDSDGLGGPADAEDVKWLRLEVVVQRAEAKTPSEVAGELRAEVERLRPLAAQTQYWHQEAVWLRTERDAILRVYARVRRLDVSRWAYTSPTGSCFTCETEAQAMEAAASEALGSQGPTAVLGPEPGSGEEASDAAN
jgi:hypothetical protein